MSYRKSIAPQLLKAATPEIAASVGALTKWVDDELRGVENELRIPELRGLQFERLAAIPDRYKLGDLYYGAAGVFGAAEGLYLYDVGPPVGWRKL